MASWDSVQTIGPPSLVPPKIDFSPLGELGTAYYQGQQAQRQQALQNAFKGGLPRVDPNDPNSAVDYKAMTQKYLELGAPEQAMAIQKQGIGQGLFDQSAKAQTDFDNSVKYGPGYVPGQQTPGGLRSQTQSTEPSQQGVATAPVHDPNLTDADQITPRQAAAANAPAQPSVQPQPVTAQPSVQPQPVQPQDGFQPTPSQIAAAAVHIPPTANPIFKQYPGAYADLLDKRANFLDREIDAGKYAGIELKGREEEVKAKRELSAKIREQLQPTVAQRDVQENIEGRKKGQLDEATRSGALYNGIVSASRQYQKEGSQFNNLAKSTLNQPETYTGIGANGVLDLNKIRALYGDQKAAQYGELINKLSSANVLSQITNVKFEGSEGGQTGGKIFAQQVALAEKAAIQQTGTLAGMRSLAEIQGRMGDYSVRLHHLANGYYKQHGKLDAGFDDLVEKDMAARPLFSKAEMQNPSLLGVPTSPFTDPGQTAAWGQKMGLKDDDPIRTPNGRIIHIIIHPKPQPARAM